MLSTNKYNKRYVGKLKGFKIYLVDGNKVRRDHVQFVQGGHGLVYPWITKDEIWIDDILRVKARDYYAVRLHELYEAVKMRDQAWSYSKAHAMANKIEKEYRNKYKK